MIRLLGHNSGASRHIAALHRSSHAIRAFSATPLGTPYSKLTVGIPKENFPLEKRVAATPESVKRLVKPGFSVVVEDGAGDTAHFSNADYEAAGAKIVPNVFGDADIILKLRPPSEEQIEQLDSTKTIFSFLYPRQDPDLLQKLQDKGTTAFAMDMIPRTLSRGQTYDALSVSKLFNSLVRVVIDGWMDGEERRILYCRWRISFEFLCCITTLTNSFSSHLLFLPQLPTYDNVHSKNNSRVSKNSPKPTLVVTAPSWKPRMPLAAFLLDK